MLIIPGYEIQERAGEYPLFSLFKGMRMKDRSPVRLTLYRADHLSGDGTARLKNKLSRIRDLPSGFWPRTLDILDLPDGMVHILAPFDGLPLAEAIPDTKKDLRLFLETALRLASALGALHQNKILHEGLHPAAAWINAERNKVFLTGFGWNPALCLSGAARALPLLSYVSPEGTGHTDLEYDERSDLYSLGVVLYEALTGELPFPSSDPLELLHSHLAVRPPTPKSRNPKIPNILSDIIMKLLAKDPEERYQGAFGLRADLLSIADLGLRNVDLKSEIEKLNFPLGAKDVPCRIRIRKRVIGREKEKAALLEIFERTAQGAAEAVHVFGRPGMGKTSLVNEIKNPVLRRNGFFLSGKYNLFSENLPYSGLAQAFQDLIRQLLARGREETNAWKEKILGVLGENSGVLVPLVPDLQRLIGPQPEAQALGPTKTRNRFLHACREFLSLFASPEHPLVLFLDDLHWAGQADLDLLKTLFFRSGLKHALLIGAFRDNEIGPVHPLAGFLEETAAPASRRMEIPPLQGGHIREMVMDSLFGLKSAIPNPKSEIEELAGILWQKSLGNPFDAGALLLSLERQGLLSFRGEEGWGCDLEKIRGMEVSENAAGVIMEKFSSLSSEALGLLKLASISGHRSRKEVLKTAWGGEDFDAALSEILSEGLCARIGEELVFSHDRVREAALELMPEEEKKECHLRIGNALLNRPGAGTNKGDAHAGEDREETLFQILQHLNEAEALITSPDQRINLAKLNLEGGKRARLSMAFHSALDCCRAGLALVPTDAWEGMFELALGLNRERCDMEALAGDFKKSERLFLLLMEKAQGMEERSDLYSRRISILESVSRFHEAKDLGLKALAEFGIRLSGKAGRLSLLLESLKAKRRLKKKRVEELFPMGATMDAREAALCKIYNSLGTVLYNTDPRLFALVSLRMLNLCAARKIFILNVLHFCAIFCATLGEINRARAFIDHALEATKKTEDRLSHHRADFIRSAYVDPWRLSFKETIASLRKVRVSLRATGDFLWDAFALCHLSVHGFMQGEVMGKSGEIDEYAADPDDRTVFQVLILFQCAKKSLQGRTRSPLALDDGETTEEALARELLTTPLSSGIFYILKGAIFYIHGAFRESLEMLQEAEKYEEGLLGQVFRTELPFYRTLGMAALFSSSSPRTRRRFSRRMHQDIRQMKKWAEDCPENFLHKYYLMDAERERVSGDALKAMDLYDKAMETAGKNGFIHHAAMACELAGRFYYTSSKFKVQGSKLGGMCLREACSGYHQLGAMPKVHALEEEFAFLKTGRGDAATEEGADSGKMDLVDAASILESARIISGELSLKNLLVKMMEVMLETSGAEKGCLLLAREGNLTVEAEGRMLKREEDGHEKKGEDRFQIAALESLPLEENGRLPIRIVNYVAGALETLVLHDAAREGPFTGEPCVAENGLKSILCLPILRESALIGILYLENNLAPGVFTAGRLEVLNHLARQAAVSLENAALHDRVSRSEEAQRQFSRRLVESQEAERKRIAAELHDSLAQNMTIIHGEARKKLESSSPRPEEETDSLNVISSTALRSLAEIREISYNLRPPQLDELGLKQALQSLIKRVSRSSNLNIRGKIDINKETIPPEMEIQIFRIVQEGMTNMIKHSEATEGAVEIVQTNGDLHLEISDNGKGFDGKTKNGDESNGFGMRSMEERVRLCGGTFRVDSRPAKGTRVEALIPLK